MDLCLESCEGNTIDIIPDGTNIGFILHVTTEEELSTIPHIEVTYGSKWNQNTVKLGKVFKDNNSNTFHSQQHTFGYQNVETGYYSCLDNGTEEAVLHSVNLELVNMGAN